MVIAMGGIRVTVCAAELPDAVTVFVDDNCRYCHDGASAQGGLDFGSLGFDLCDKSTFDRWLQIHGRVQRGEMPPPEEVELDPSERQVLLDALAPALTAADRLRIAEQGRAAVRRLNREEYENTLRVVLDAPWLHVADLLPADGVAHLFNKSAECLDVSHVQMTRYLVVAEHALRLAAHAAAHPTQAEKFYAREEPVLQNYLRYRFGQKAATRSIVPLDGLTPEPDVIRGKQPMTVGDADPEKREREAMGVFSGTYAATTKYDFTRMVIPTDGRYRLRFKTYSFMSGPNGASGGDDHGLTGGNRAWWRPDRNVAMRSPRSEPITLYALTESGDSRWLATLDSQPDPTVFECMVSLRAGERIRPDAARLVRTRPGWRGNPNATKEGVPGFAMNWLEVIGPLHDEWPPPSYQALFEDLSFETDEDAHVRVLSECPDEDARRLLVRFLRRAYRRPLESEAEVEPFFFVYEQAASLGEDFTDAMLAAMSAILCSPGFLYLEMPPGPLNEYELASRMAYFLWNGPPDERLVRRLHDDARAALHGEADRLLDDARSDRFVRAFLDYWLDLRDVNANAPDAELYPDYYLDELLTESSVRETRMFFRELIDKNLSVRNLVDADFTFVNERLAEHYGLPATEGVNPRRVDLPDDSPRGGLLTQASVLRVTANGTTTSPVIRGAWIMERILGLDIPPPPSGVAAIEPDIRGATTIREQLEKHRRFASCNDCHRQFDPAGFALESFDVAGGWRDRYRAVGDKGDLVQGIGKNGHTFRFRLAEEVECAGALDRLGPFDDAIGLKVLLAADERRLARNLLGRLILYATGAPVSFADRAEVEAMLDRAAEHNYGVRTLIHEVVESELFRHK